MWFKYVYDGKTRKGQNPTYLVGYLYDRLFHESWISGYLANRKLTTG